ncbi:MAG: hypothetical protein PHD63_04340 [Candidatus Marinimicrobia bacterium]|nr:hypothetical protein [Candidatus Neomarinimicrobiota bacterium]
MGAIPEPMKDFFGETPVSAITGGSGKPAGPEEGNKYKEFVNAVYNIVHPTEKEQINQQTDLEWENIVGEIKLEILKNDIVSGVSFEQVQGHPYLHFANPQECLDKLFVQEFVEKLHDRHLLPSMTFAIKYLNELKVSYQRKGRAELIQMFQAFTLSLQEHEHNDSTGKRLGLRLP